MQYEQLLLLPLIIISIVIILSEELLHDAERDLSNDAIFNDLE